MDSANSLFLGGKCCGRSRANTAVVYQEMPMGWICGEDGLSPVAHEDVGFITGGRQPLGRLRKR